MARIYRRSNSSCLRSSAGENRANPIGLAAPVRPGKGRCNKSKLIFLFSPFSKRSELDCLRVPQFSKSVLFRSEGEGGVTRSS